MPNLPISCVCSSSSNKTSCSKKPTQRLLRYVAPIVTAVLLSARAYVLVSIAGQLRTGRRVVPIGDQPAEGGPRSSAGMHMPSTTLWTLSPFWLTANLPVQRMNREVEQRYQREQALMLSAWHELNMRSLLDSVASNNGARRSTGPSAWLGQQRQRTVGKSLVRSYSPLLRILPGSNFFGLQR
jgi:hypothetical protein